MRTGVGGAWAFALAGVLSLVGGVAFAQDDPPPIIIIDDTKKPDERQDPNPAPDSDEPRGFRPHVSLLIGGFLPVGGLRDAFPNHAGATIHLGVNLNNPRKSNPFVASFFVEGNAITQGVPAPFDSVFPRSTAEYYGNLGGGLEGVLYLSQGAPFRLYTGAGIGFHHLIREVSYSGNAFLEPVFARDDIFSSSRTAFGWRLLAGAEIGRYLVTEVRYMDAGVLDGVAFRGLSVSLGVRY